MALLDFKIDVTALMRSKVCSVSKPLDMVLVNSCLNFVLLLSGVLSLIASCRNAIRFGESLKNTATLCTVPNMFRISAGWGSIAGLNLSIETVSLLVLVLKY